MNIIYYLHGVIHKNSQTRVTSVYYTQKELLKVLKLRNRQRQKSIRFFFLTNSTFENIFVAEHINDRIS